MKIQIKFQKSTKWIDIEDSATFQSLKEKAETEFSLKQILQKWIVPPKIKTNLNDDDSQFENSNHSLASIGFVDGMKIMLIEKKIQEAQKLNMEGAKQANILENRKKFHENFKVKENGSPSNNVNNNNTSMLSQSSKFTFHKVEVLPQFKDSERAIQLLNRIRTDVGVQYIMNKYQWSVGILKEIHPNEQATILGYNQNKGEVIALRLRTDDLEGFRAYDMIKKVLMHELAHMVYSEHNNEFLALNRKLNDEVKQGDWTRKGHKLTSTETHSFEENEQDSSLLLSSSSLSSLRGNYPENQKSFILGETPMNVQKYDSSLDPGTLRLSMREQMYTSAIKRLTKEEKDIMDACG